MRSKLLHKAMASADTLEKEWLHDLRGDFSDLQNPSMLEINRRLRQVIQGDPSLTYAYVLSVDLRGEAFYMVGNEETGSAGFVYPGTHFVEAPPEVARVGALRESKVTAPYTDRWGKWVTALVPLTETANPSRVKVLGLDMDHALWASSLRSDRLRSASWVFLATAFFALLCWLADWLSRRALKVSDKRYRLLFESSPDPRFILVNGRFVDCNQATESAFMATKRELIGRAPAELSPDRQPNGEDSQVSAQDKVWSALSAGSQRFDWLHIRSNGEAFLADVVLTAIPGGESGALHVALRDVTLERKAAQVLQESERTLRTYMDASPDGLLVFDRSGCGLDANASACQLTGYERGELLGAKLDRLLGPAGELDLSQIVEKLESVGSYESEARLRRKDGFEFHGRVRAKPATGSAFIFSITDITKQKEHSEQLRKLVAHVPGMVFQCHLHPDGQYTMPYVSDGAVEVFRLPAHRAKGDALSVLARVHHEDRSRLLDGMTESARTLAICNLRFRLRLPGGRLRWVEAAATPERQPDGSTL